MSKYLISFFILFVAFDANALEKTFDCKTDTFFAIQGEMGKEYSGSMHSMCVMH